MVADIAPVGDGAFGLAGDAVRLEVVRVDGSGADEIGRDALTGTST